MKEMEIKLMSSFEELRSKFNPGDEYCYMTYQQFLRVIPLNCDTLKLLKFQGQTNLLIAHVIETKDGLKRITFDAIGTYGSCTSLGLYKGKSAAEAEEIAPDYDIIVKHFVNDIIEEDVDGKTKIRIIHTDYSISELN